MMGIYMITNLKTDERYIGQSIDIQKRWEEHRRNSSNKPLRAAIKKYGLHNFSFEVLVQVLYKKDLDAQEKHFIALYDTFNSGYNRTQGGQGFSIHKKGIYTENAIMVIKFLQDNIHLSGKLYSRDLVKALNIQLPAVSGCITGLAKKGYIEKNGCIKIFDSINDLQF